MAAPGTVWADDTWDVDAWADDTWADASAPIPPHLVLTPADLTFNGTESSSNPPDQDIAVTNSGGGSLALTLSAITYDTGSGWLATALNGAIVTALIDLTGLADGVYVAHFDVEDSGADNSPQTVDVTLTIAPYTPSTGGAVSPRMSAIRRQVFLG